MGYVYREAKARQIPTPVSVTWVERCCLSHLTEGGLCLQNAHRRASLSFEELRSALKLRPQTPVWSSVSYWLSRDTELLFPYSVYCGVKAQSEYIATTHAAAVSNNHDHGYQNYAYSTRISVKLHSRIFVLTTHFIAPATHPTTFSTARVTQHHLRDLVDTCRVAFCFVLRSGVVVVSVAGTGASASMSALATPRVHAKGSKNIRRKLKFSVRSSNLSLVRFRSGMSSAL